MTDGLFPEPEHSGRSLSRLYDTKEFRTDSKRLSRYARYAARADCDECFAVQYEAGLGQLSRTRSMATVRRSITAAKDLLLCGQHAYLWRKKDGYDN